MLCSGLLQMLRGGADAQPRGLATGSKQDQPGVVPRLARAWAGEMFPRG